jgi:hypothetical protein
MGEVYRGRDLALGRPVAIKVLAADLGEDDALVARFEREARAVASARSYASGRRWRAGSPRRTRAASSTATSSPRTCS